MAKTLIALFLSIGLSAAFAQTLRDPTQPPLSFSAAGGQSTAAEDVSVDQVPVLNSIIRRHGAKPVAVINGEMVRQGGKVGDWVLVKIAESEVLLEGQGGREKLTLSPGVEKRPAKVAGRLRVWR